MGGSASAGMAGGGGEPAAEEHMRASFAEYADKLEALEKIFREDCGAMTSDDSDQYQMMVRNSDPSLRWECASCPFDNLSAGIFRDTCFFCQTARGTSFFEQVWKHHDYAFFKKTGVAKLLDEPPVETLMVAPAQLASPRATGGADAAAGGGAGERGAVAAAAPAAAAGQRLRAPTPPPPLLSPAGPTPSSSSSAPAPAWAPDASEVEDQRGLDVLANQADAVVTEAKRAVDQAMVGLEDALRQLRQASARLRGAREELLRAWAQADGVACKAARQQELTLPLECPVPWLASKASERSADESARRCLKETTDASCSPSLPSLVRFTEGTKWVANASVDVFDDIAFNRDRTWRPVATLCKNEVVEAWGTPIAIQGTTVQVVPVTRSRGPRGLVDLFMLRRAADGVQVPPPEPPQPPAPKPKPVEPAPKPREPAASPEAPAKEARGGQRRGLRPRGLLLGDSMVEESFYDDYGSRSFVGWVTLLQHHLKRKVDALNYGFNGYNTRQVRAVLPKILQDPAFDDPLLFAVVMLGANDAALECNRWQHVPLSEYKDNLEQIVKYLQQRGCQHIILLGPTPVSESKWPDRSNSQMDTYSQAAVEVAQRTGVKYKNIYKHMRAFPDYPTLLSDGLHFSAKGQREAFACVRALLPGLPAEDLPGNEELVGQNYMEVRRKAIWHPNLRELGELASEEPPLAGAAAKLMPAKEDSVKGCAPRPGGPGDVRLFEERLSSAGPHACYVIKEDVARIKEGVQRLEQADSEKFVQGASALLSA